MKKDSKISIAKRYAKALYLSAESKSALAAVHKDINKLLPVFTADPSVLKTLSNPLWNKKQKKEALVLIAKKISLDKKTLECLDIINDNDRFAELDLILKTFNHLYFEEHNIVEIDVASVKKLSPVQEKRLQKVLEKGLSSKVILHHRIIPGILGGLVVSFKSKMFDDSLKTKLNKIEFVVNNER